MGEPPILAFQNKDCFFPKNSSIAASTYSLASTEGRPSAPLSKYDNCHLLEFRLNPAAAGEEAGTASFFTYSGLANSVVVAPSLKAGFHDNWMKLV